MAVIRRRGIRGHAQFQGSKRRGRVIETESAESRRLRRDLGWARRLMAGVRSRHQLDAILSQIADPVKRQAVDKLLTPMLRVQE